MASRQTILKRNANGSKPEDVPGLGQNVGRMRTGLCTNLPYPEMTTKKQRWIKNTHSKIFNFFNKRRFIFYRVHTYLIC